MELSAIPRFVPEPYGLEDDQRSMGFDEPDYGLGHPMHYSTVPRNHHAFPHGPPRRTGYAPCVSAATLPVSNASMLVFTRMFFFSSPPQEL